MMPESIHHAFSIDGVILKWHVWDGEFVVFDSGSGNTHYLEAPAAAILRLIQSKHGHVKLEQVISCLSGLFENDNEIDLTSMGLAILSDLARLGLIETR